MTVFHKRRMFGLWGHMSLLPNASISALRLASKVAFQHIRLEGIVGKWNIHQTYSDVPGHRQVGTRSCSSDDAFSIVHR
uniref:Uncharacterized protein n=1 Tax=Triticum urartu TaxID=4572 RepID=A0A8R7PWP0_TRIUA